MIRFHCTKIQEAAVLRRDKHNKHYFRQAKTEIDAIDGLPTRLVYVECSPQNGTSNGENVCTKTSPRRIYKIDHSGLSALMFPKPSSVSIGNRLGASGWRSLHIATIIFPTMRENYGINGGQLRHDLRQVFSEPTLVLFND